MAKEKTEKKTTSKKTTSKVSKKESSKESKKETIKKPSVKKILKKVDTKESAENKPVVKKSYPEIIDTKPKDTVGAKNYAKKTKPGDFKSLEIAIAETCSRAYNINKPKDKDLIIDSAMEQNVSIIPMSIHCNWGRHCHRQQIEMYVKHFARKMGYIEAGFQMDETSVKFNLIGPFAEELLQETF